MKNYNKISFHTHKIKILKPEEHVGKRTYDTLVVVVGYELIQPFGGTIARKVEGACTQWPNNCTTGCTTSRHRESLTHVRRETCTKPFV